MNNREENTKINFFKGELKQYKSKGLKEIPSEKVVEIGECLGKVLKEKNVKTTQIRKFLDAVRKIQIKFDKDNVIMLKPKLAYTVGRHRNLKPLMQILDPAIDAGAKDRESFKKLVHLIEAIVAYHRFYGGGD
ncbi:type III-A CRISPR-associated protein Csm2 [Thermodesulfatator autotrophicus]|uniref:CRISPR system Cms protein Csm2 n=1 Tax=Thermodesulfatator autotrophicus TaxID=1795632 RepID=A0A177E658_9BACT|nr:type III-A CRISPR-associated protein Csm2 [Thermodesulfatator autotrophicus]OAG26712.1 hypothetical protein TH606_10910 [Thermodesulfatator autotrophicus]